MILTRVLSAVIPLLDDDADASGVCGATEDEAKPSLRRLLPHCPHWPLHVLLHGSPHSPDPNSEACIRKAEALRTRKPHSYTRKSKPETTRISKPQPIIHARSFSWLPFRLINLLTSVHWVMPYPFFLCQKTLTLTLALALTLTLTLTLTGCLCLSMSVFVSPGRCREALE